MKKFLFCLGLFLVSAMYGSAQTACSTSNPCVQVTVTNSFMAANPGTVNIYKCQGSQTNCSQTALNTFISNGGASVWVLITPFAQTTATAKYNDPEPYGSLMNYAASNSTSAGGTGPVSAILIFSVPGMPPAPSLSVTVVTTGNVGPQ